MGRIEAVIDTSATEASQNFFEAEFPLGSAQAFDDLVQYLDQLRVDNLPVGVKFKDCDTPGAVRVQFPLPVQSIAESIKTLRGIIIESQAKEKK